MTVTPATFDLANGRAVLERTPRVLRELLDALPQGWIDRTEGPGTWSPYDVIGHLIHGERTDWIARARIILEQGSNRRFEPFDRFAQFRESEGKSVRDLLDEFELLRRENLRILDEWQLTPVQLRLQGEHPALGRVSLEQLLATWVVHDLNHIGQIARVMAKRYRDAVGPWREYLPILDRG